MLLTSLMAGLVLAQSGGAAAERTIASATVDDFRVSVRAVKGPGDGGAPLASVQVEAFVKRAGKWRSVGRRTVGRPDGFFWFPLTGPGGVRRFTVESFPVKRVTFQLLITPSAGFSPIYRYRVQGQRLVAG
jgi:hypothetical protein